jgi:hypothetical protein
VSEALFSYSEEDDLGKEEIELKNEIKKNKFNDLNKSRILLAKKIEKFINKRIDHEIEEIDSISDFTRKWVETYNKMLDGMQKVENGGNDLNINIVSHGDIAAKIREMNKK